MLGQGADRDVVHPGGGELGQGGQGHVAGNLQPGPALAASGIQGHRLAHHGHIEVVQHDDVGAGIEGLTQLGQGLDLDLDRFARVETTGLVHRFHYAATGQDVVLLDEVGVIQADAMVLAAAAGDRVFLGIPQTGQGLAGVEQAALGAGQLGHVAGRDGGDAAEGLHEVQGIALAGQQYPGRAMEAKQFLIGGEQVSILHLPLHLHLAAELGEHFIHPGLAAENPGFPGDDAGAGLAIRRDQLGRDVGAGIRLVLGGQRAPQIFE